LLEEVKTNYQICKTTNEIDELKVKYEIEKKGKRQKIFNINKNTKEAT
jgi:hypothetical protein